MPGSSLLAAGGGPGRGGVLMLALMMALTSGFLSKYRYCWVR